MDIGAVAPITLGPVATTQFCSVGNVSLAITNPLAGVNYTWRSVPAGYSASGTTASFSNLTRTTTFYVQGRSGSCVSSETSKTVTVETTAATPSVLSSVYRKTTLTTSSGAAFHYWQRTPDGRDLSIPMGNTARVVFEPGDYYVRKYTASLDCWSTATTPAHVVIDYVPPVASIIQVQKPGYNTIILANGDKTHLLKFATYYWVKDASDAPEIDRPFNNGVTIVGSDLDRSGTYYLKGRDNGTGTWGPTLVIQASVRIADGELNWIQTTAYDGTWHKNGNDTVFHVAGESKAYFRRDGGPLQTQTRNLTTGRILASQPLYDRFDKPAGQTLAAPIKYNAFSYSSLFALSSTGGAYGYKDFDREGTAGAGTMLEPLGMAGSGEGSLGWYYSAQNTLEPNTPRTNYPYARTVEFPNMADGKIRQSAGPGDQHHLGTGHDQTEYKGATRGLLDDYLKRRRTLGLTDHRIKNKLDSGVVRSMVKDEQGRFVYSWADLSGRVLVTAHGDGEEGLVDIKAYKDVVYNFYDDAGRLVSAVSPNGMLEWFSDADLTVKYPAIDKTTYIYDFQGRLLEMTEPDAGTTRYVYRKDGQIRFSQNAVQRAKGYFSYTHYDMLSRAVESGEYIDVASTLDFVAMNDPAFRGSPMEGQLEKLSHEISWPATAKRSWVRTTYDVPDGNFRNTTALPESEYTQRYVRGAVSRSENQNMMTWYSYDELGRVVWMAQKPAKLPMIFVVRYRYNFLGNVLMVSNLTYAAPGAPGAGSNKPLEEFYHHYEYDADKRLSKAYTSTTATGEKFLRARYEYYLHGPLKRIELGNKTQGVDFVYNIQGWLRQINHPDPLQDPGADGNDAFGMVLDYYESDMNNLIPTAGVVDPYRSHAVPEALRATTMTHAPLLRFLPEPPVGSGTEIPSLQQYSADSPVYQRMLQHSTLNPANR
ncbi:Ig-like domain-containing protein [Parachryseolinea silvisoli]|uniref:Ig-like domain-containing protein n=1 Tax=Parachryseolinea silvisoli TaxID=2873601 RepID=UPI002265CF83|nr:hypothetical protein [Parachryseolinea silvisoli]